MLPDVCYHVTAWIRVQCSRLQLWAVCVVWSLGCGTAGPPPYTPDHRIALIDGQLPVAVPSILDIKRVVPAHCFRPRLSRSLYYVAKDLSFLVVLYALVLWLECQPSKILHYAALPAYWFIQGTVMWGIFVLGHDCGHGSFSAHQRLNDVIGACLHSILLVPFYPWKLSHKHHHRHTNNIDKDEIFYPVRQRDRKADLNLIHPVFGFGLSWLMYLVAGYKPRPVSHLNPFNPMFKGHVTGCACSLGLVAVWATVLGAYAWRCGLASLTSHYLIPYFVFASWLVVVTFLHHMDTHIPWYSDSQWTNVKGQLSSIDRHYGWAHELTHNIGTHQLHHLFSKIPHYHLEEATYHFRQKFPHLVQSSSAPILPTFLRMFSIFDEQRYIGDAKLIHVFT